MVTKNSVLIRLKEIENKERVRILYAAELGSRGWGFESKDSDYDVRFIYAHPLDWYLSVEEGRDVIEYPLSNNLDLDISGWDIKKALKLFKSSNPPLYEWLSSPIVYLENGNFTKRLRGLIPLFYSPISSMHHYLSMAKGNYKSYPTGQKVKVKKYFYVLRPIFACMWIEKYDSIPPMEYKKLFTVQKLNKSLFDEIQKLLVRKKAGEELDLENRRDSINQFIEEKIEHFKIYARRLDRRPSFETKVLDELLKDTILAA